MVLEEKVPLPAEISDLRKVAFDAPWNWLAAGWRDLWSAPHISLTYGAAFSFAAYALIYGLFRSGTLPFILPLAGGFMLIGPLLAVGLYEVSRRRELGEGVSFAAVLHAGKSVRGQLASFGMLLFLIFFAWVLLAFLLFMLFFGPANFRLPPSEFIPTLLFTPHGLGLLITGTATGAVFAATTYAVSAIAVPLLLDRNADAVTAAMLSVRAVLTNFPAMALWAVLILGMTAGGIASLFLGLVITFPLIGHATWHAYREIAGGKSAP